MAHHQLTITARGATYDDLEADALRQVTAYLGARDHADTTARRAIDALGWIPVEPADQTETSFAEALDGKTSGYLATITVTLR